MGTTAHGRQEPQRTPRRASESIERPITDDAATAGGLHRCEADQVPKSSNRPQAEADRVGCVPSKPGWPNKINNSDIRMQKRHIGTQVKEESKNGSLDVFERLFQSAAREKNRIVARAKENIAKKTKEANSNTGSDRKQVDKTVNILRENKRLINNTRSEAQDGRVAIPTTSLVL